MNEDPAADFAPDFDALLEADLVNIVNLVTAGVPLSKQQRERLEDEQRKSRAREAAAAQPSAPPAVVAVPVLNPSPATAPLPPPVPGEYRRKQSEYAEFYGYGVRAIKLWISEGRAATPPSLPPLDDPEVMPNWWGVVKTNACPPRLMAAAEAARAARIAASPPPQAPPAPVSPPAAEAAAKVSMATGYAATLERVRVAEAAASKRWLDAFNAPDGLRNDSLVSRLQKDWQTLSENLRALEKGAAEVLKNSGEMLLHSEVRKILRELHAPIVSGVRSLFRRVRSKAKAGATLDDLEKLYADETEKLFGNLLASEFGQAVAVDPAALEA